jgi:hypothetical protein
VRIEGKTRTSSKAESGGKKVREEEVKNLNFFGGWALVVFQLGWLDKGGGR